MTPGSDDGTESARPRPPRPARLGVLLRFALWHVLGFAVVFAAFEAWSLWRHGRHADLVQRFLPAPR